MIRIKIDTGISQMRFIRNCKSEFEFANFQKFFFPVGRAKLFLMHFFFKPLDPSHRICQKYTFMLKPSLMNKKKMNWTILYNLSVLIVHVPLHMFMETLFSSCFVLICYCSSRFHRVWLNSAQYQGFYSKLLCG